MSGLAMPPAEPPSASVLDLLGRLSAAQEHLTEAQRQLAVLEVARNDVETLSAGSVMYFRIERLVARNRIVLWTRELRALERRGRAMGLQL